MPPHCPLWHRPWPFLGSPMAVPNGSCLGRTNGLRTVGLEQLPPIWRPSAQVSDTPSNVMEARLSPISAKRLIWLGLTRESVGPPPISKSNEQRQSLVVEQAFSKLLMLITSYGTALRKTRRARQEKGVTFSSLCLERRPPKLHQPR